MSDNLKISVDFYNDVEKALFQEYPNAVDISKVIGEDIEISKDEFKAYMMFTKQMDIDGYRTYDELKSHISEELGNMENFISFEDDSVKSLHPSSIINQIHYTERIGVALGLCLTNKIHGLSQADWKKIPESTLKKTLDYDLPLASDGTKFIKVENKGSVTVDNRLKGSLSTQLNHIKAKKETARAEDCIDSTSNINNLYYGTIGVLDNRDESKAKVWLVDPPAFEMDMDPRKYKLLARLHYYLDEFKTIGVKESIIVALQNRIKLIANSDDFMQYNNSPLKKKFVSSNYNNFMQGKTYTLVDSTEAFGKTYIVNLDGQNYCFLIAYPRSLMRLIVNQDFEDILKYDYNPDFLQEDISIKIRVSPDMEEDYRSVEDLNFVYNQRNKMTEALFNGKVSKSTDGRIFGLLAFETRETPKGGNKLVNPPVVKGKSLGFTDLVQNDALKQKKLGFNINPPTVKSPEILSKNNITSNSQIEDYLMKISKAKKKAKDNDNFELLAEI